MIVFNGLVLPVMGLTAGYITSTWVVLLTGYISYYTASLIVTHLGKARNMKESILAHFKEDYKYMTVYSIINWMSFVPLIFINFSFICLEIEGILGYHSPWVAPSVAVFFIIIISIIRIFHFAEETQAMGIVGLVLFIIFMIYAQITAPSGPKTVSANGNPFILAGSLITMLELHNFLAENIIKNKNKNEYQKIVKMAFLIGTIFYLFSTFGSFCTFLVI